MKIIYRVLTLLCIILFFCVTVLGADRHLGDIVPNTKETLIVTNWDKSKSSQEIYDHIREYAQKNHVDIHKIVYSLENKNTVKNIFTFSKDGESDYTYPTKEKNVSFYDSKKLKEETLLTPYLFTTNAPKDICTFFQSQGLECHLEKVNFYNVFQLNSLEFFVIVLLFVTILSSFLYKISQTKKIGIYKLHAKSLTLLFAKDLLASFFFIGLVTVFFSIFQPLYTNFYIQLAEFLLLFFLTIEGISFLFSYVSTTFSQKIKGKRNVRLLCYANLCLKAVVLFCLFFFINQTIQNIHSAQQVSRSLGVWKKIGNYYTLSISATSDLEGDSAEEMERRFAPLFQQKHTSENLLVNTNLDGLKLRFEQQNEKKDNLEFIETHPFMSVNQTYCQLAREFLGEDWLQPRNNDDFTCLLPKKFKNQKDQIVEELRSRISNWTNKNLKDQVYYMGKIQVSFYENDTTLPTFNTQDFNLENTMIEAPVILVLPNKVFQTYTGNYYSAMSRSMYLFKDADEVIKTIQKYGLKRDVKDLVLANSLATQLHQKVQQEIVLGKLLIALQLAIFILVAVYYSASYVLQNQKRIFLKEIVGKSFLAIYGDYLFKTIGISVIIFVIYQQVFKINSNFPVYIILFEIIFSCVVVKVISGTNSILKSHRTKISDF